MTRELSTRSNDGQYIRQSRRSYLKLVGSATASLSVLSGTVLGEPTQSGTLFELIAGADTRNITYEFVVEGDVTRVTDREKVNAEGNDSITNNDDGTVTVSGLSGNGYGDAYRIDGVIIDITLDESLWTLRHDGQVVSVDEIVFPKLLTIDGRDSPRGISLYKFTVDGAAVKSAVHSSINAYDQIESGTITGRVIGGKDAYRFSGEITHSRFDGPVNITITD